MALTHSAPTSAPLSARGLVQGLLAIPAHGRPQQALSKQLTAYMGSSETLLAGSGRTALYLLLRQLQKEFFKTDRTRRYVVMPAYGCPAVARVVEAAGLSLRLVDIDPATLDYVPDLIGPAIDEEVAAVVLIHPLGFPCPVASIASLARNAGAWLIEDVAQTLGAVGDDGRAVGHVGEFALGSFGLGKPVSAGGGGILFANTTKAAELATAAWLGLPTASSTAAVVAWLRALAFDFAIRRAPWWTLTRLGLDRHGDSESSWRFQVRGLTSAQAALALDGMNHLDHFVAARRRNASFLLARIQGNPALRTAGPDWGAGRPAYLRLPVLARDAASREATYAVFRRHGVGVGKLYLTPIHRLFPRDERSFPGAEQVARCILTLPTHPRLNGDDLNQMSAALHAAARLKGD